MSATRYLVIRVPDSGPKALAGPPNDFGSRSEAEARIGEITSEHRKAHHTHLEIMKYTGDKADALRNAGVLF